MIKGIKSNREPISLWRIAIPADQDREKYIEQCFNTNTVSITSRYGEVLHRVPIPNNAIQEIDWPVDAGSFGSQVIVGSIKSDGDEFPVVLNTVRTFTKFEHNKENAYRWHKATDTSHAEILIRGKDGYISLNVASADADGGKVVLNISNQESAGELDVVVNGQANIKATNIGQTATAGITDTITANENVNEDKYITTFNRTLEGIEITSSKGEDDEAVSSLIKLTADGGYELTLTSGDDIVNTIKFVTDEGFTYTDQYENSVSIAEEQIDIVSAGEVINLGDGAEKMVLGDTLAQLLKDLIQEISIASTPSGPLANAAAIAAYIQQVDNILSSYSNTQ